MTYRLEAAKPNYDAFECQNKLWTWILDVGPGLVLGFVSLGANGRCWLEALGAVGGGIGRPDDNSGFVVPESHARAMADAIQTAVSVQEHVISLYEKARGEAERTGLNQRFQHTPFGRGPDGVTPFPSSRFLSVAKELAAWMRDSGGFTIN